MSSPRVGVRCRCCGKLRSDLFRPLPSDPHRCGSAYVQNYLGQWDFPRDRFGVVLCCVGGYAPCPVQEGGKCRRQKLTEAKRRTLKRKGAAVNLPLYCWHVFWDREVNPRSFYAEPTEVWSRNALDAVRVAVIKACEFEGLDPDELPPVVGVVEVLDPPVSKGASHGTRKGAF